MKENGEEAFGVFFSPTGEGRATKNCMMVNVPVYSGRWTDLK